MSLIALTREISSSFAQCELTHLQREPIDVPLARSQHAAYEQQLAGLGCRLLRLPETPDLPDAVFVEDAAIVLEELAVITRPGAASRRPETAAIADALRPYRKLVTIMEPGIIDGGDVLRLGKALYVGLSTRSNLAAIEQLRNFLAPFDYTVSAVEVAGCLHLKSAVTQIAADSLLLNPAWVAPDLFANWEWIEVDPAEPYAANAVWIGDAVIYPQAFPLTRRKLEKAGIDVKVVDVSEISKAEGAVTCCSLIFNN
jgi:dimethylargininase